MEDTRENRVRLLQRVQGDMMKGKGCCWKIKILITDIKNFYFLTIVVKYCNIFVRREAVGPPSLEGAQDSTSNSPDQPDLNRSALSKG